MRCLSLFVYHQYVLCCIALMEEVGKSPALEEHFAAKNNLNAFERLIDAVFVSTQELISANCDSTESAMQLTFTQFRQHLVQWNFFNRSLVNFKGSFRC